MTWNHRVIKSWDTDGHVSYGVHEVYYDGDKITGWTDDEAEKLISESLRGCLWQWAAIGRALSRPVLRVVGDKLEEIEEGESLPEDLLRTLTQIIGTEF
jgi:hypothetical protein